jgi:threonine synthase
MAEPGSRRLAPPLNYPEGIAAMRVPELTELLLRCADCGRDHPVPELAWQCADCAGLLNLHGTVPTMPNPAVLASRPPTLWRYRESLPLPVPAGLTMGEGMTPLLDAPSSGPEPVQVKLDYLMPTGSFKDRGAVLLVALAAALGVPRLIADSSGNAGTAIAAYAARAGIGCEVFVPGTTSEGKLGQLRGYGAEVHLVDGNREDTAAAAVDAVRRRGLFYASHVYQPIFLHGTKTYLLELWEQRDGRLPDTLVLPVGNGTLVLGAYLGGLELAEQGLIDRLPRIVAVQAASCAPLAEALADGLPEPAPISAVRSSVGVGSTIAEGIAIARPARGKQILAAIRATGGTIITVADDEVRAAHAALARLGLYVEPTSAVCWAAYSAGRTGAGSAVIPLCGSGLKSTPPGH